MLELNKIFDIDNAIKEAEIVFNGEYSKPKHLMWIVQNERETPIMSRGDFSAIKGQSKGRKTFGLQIFGGAFLSQPEILFDTFKCSANTLAWFDTEQKKYDTWKCLSNCIDLGGTKKQIKMFRLRKYNPVERVAIIEKYIEDNRPDICFIDGLLDLVNAMNSEELATELTSSFMKWTEIYGIHIACVIHENYGAEKAAGHLGSFITRRAQSVIEINKDKKQKSQSYMKCSFIRGTKDFEPIIFGIDERTGLPNLISNSINECEF